MDIAPTAGDELVAMLDRLAEMIVDALGFGVAAINLARPDGSLEVVSVAGDEQAREALIGTVDSAAAWDAMLAGSEPWGALRFVDHLSPTAARPDDVSWVPTLAPLDVEDAWHPEDALFAPLRSSDEVLLGILSVDLPHAGRRPGPSTRKALEAFACSAALAIEHATLRLQAEASERRFRELATQDWLTGLGNRSMLLERLAHAVAARDDQQTLMALVFIDLNGFKAVNDRHSHAAGDQLLKAVADRIRCLVRPHDTVVRWGGDEFLVLLEGLSREDAALGVADRIRAAVAVPVQHEDGLLRVTASVGLTFHHPGDATDAEELIRRADAAMYQAKNVVASGCVTFEVEGSAEVA
jgi:diguanylate cyclase (GGDEF)-like protein